MTEINITHLVSIIRECAGDSDDFDLDGEILDVTFEDLGYDSIALLEISSRIEQEFDVAVPEDRMKTPRNTLEAINEKISEVTA